MGGMINVAIRFRNGRTVCQERWTNNTPFWFKNPKMYSGDEDYVQEYIDMTRNNDYVNEYVPGKPEPLRNNEYGLIVWDYMTNTILDNNGYSNPTHLDIYTIDMHIETFEACKNILRLESGRKVVEVSDILTEDEIQDVINACKDTESRKLKGGKTPLYDKLVADFHAAPKPDYSLDRVYQKDQGNFWFHYRFRMDTSPMTYVQFPEREFKDYKAKLIELGFPMTRKAGLNASLPLLKKKKLKVKLTELELLAKDVFQGRQVEDGFDRIFFEDLGDDDKNKYIELAKRLQANPELLQQFELSCIMGKIPIITFAV
jgi:hypothetical protein